MVPETEFMSLIQNLITDAHKYCNFRVVSSTKGFTNLMFTISKYFIRNVCVDLP